MSSLDRQKNNLSLFNVIDELNLPKEVFGSPGEKKALRLEHEIITLWRRTIATNFDVRKLEYDLSLSLIDGEGKSLQQVVTPFVFGAGKRRLRFNIQLNALPIAGPGDYCYRLEIHSPDGSASERFDIPFEVKARQ